MGYCIGCNQNFNAVKTAALAATQKATPTPEAVDTTALEKAIADAEALKEVDYTADSWKAVQTALTAAKSALSAKESQISCALFFTPCFACIRFYTEMHV